MPTDEELNAMSADIEAYAQNRTLAGEAGAGAMQAITGLVTVLHTLIKGTDKNIDTSPDGGTDEGGTPDAGTDNGKPNPDDGAGAGTDDNADDAPGDAEMHDLQLSVPDKQVLEETEIGPFLQQVSDTMVDVTAHLALAAQHMEAQRVELAAQRTELSALRKSSEHMQGIITELAGAEAKVLLELTKGVTDLKMDITKIPAPSAMPNGLDRWKPAPVVATPDNKDYIGGDKITEKRLLVKGLNTGLLDDSDIRRYRKLGHFDEDEAANAQMIEAVAALG